MFIRIVLQVPAPEWVDIDVILDDWIAEQPQFNVPSSYQLSDQGAIPFVLSDEIAIPNSPLFNMFYSNM